ncbi:paired immunoglobulin-like type 2 receptor alpha isoform X1 [Dasypus novemcinctus]|uniref:paired immunoglobulin-like type 2 receptor alpha isoform X1 n=2 Tax=Dasypus novemcinctus TaxID=9361 RepID=UPI00265DA210|nr:paired immunoglobulin-like type 2 receptor alpha isoform X1 [Dasypus novemcinctus]
MAGQRLASPFLSLKEPPGSCCCPFCRVDQEGRGADSKGGAGGAARGREGRGDDGGEGKVKGGRTGRPGRENGWGPVGSPLTAPTTREALSQPNKRRSQIHQGSACLRGARALAQAPTLPASRRGPCRLWTSPPRSPRAFSCAPVGAPGVPLEVSSSASTAVSSSHHPWAMGSPLSLLLLLLLPQAGLSAHVEIKQPKMLSGPEGGSVDIPFSIYHPWKLAKEPRLRLSWRHQHFHGLFIFNSSPSFVLEAYQGRLALTWTERPHNGSLRISGLRHQDATEYFCRVQLVTVEVGEQQWQAIQGTKLTVTPAVSTTTKPATTSAGLRVWEGDKTPASQPLNLGTTVGAALAGVAIIFVMLGLIIFLRQKRRTGQQTKAQTPARKSFQDTEVQYENTWNKGSHTDPKLDHREEGIVYASLTLSSPSSPGEPPFYPPQRSPQAETLYSALKA